MPISLLQEEGIPVLYFQSPRLEISQHQPIVEEKGSVVFSREF